jgi:hypothetical protein
MSILHGFSQQKGRVNLEVTPTITKEELELCNKEEKNDKFEKLASIINKRIYNKYKLFPTNYIAYDILNHSQKFNEQYTNEEKASFIAYMNNGLAQIQIDKQELETIFLQIYAATLQNHFSSKTNP